MVGVNAVFASAASLAVASATRARRKFPQWREQYVQVCERLVEIFNAAIASAAGQRQKKAAQGLLNTQV